MIKRPIILASASPRRRELMAQAGILFQAMPSSAKECYQSARPDEIVKELALLKAGDIRGKITGPAVIIGADTIVWHRDVVLGKPADEAEAVRMLKSLQGTTHRVYTGVAVILAGDTGTEKTVSFSECTEVTFGPMSDAEIRDYVATKEPMDKAGAYGIQGRAARYITGIRGDYSNVVGLPIAGLYRTLRELKVLGENTAG